LHDPGAVHEQRGIFDWGALVADDEPCALIGRDLRGRRNGDKGTKGNSCR
jgi:hypothetical protein